MATPPIVPILSGAAMLFLAAYRARRGGTVRSASIYRGYRPRGHGKPPRVTDAPEPGTYVAVRRNLGKLAGAVDPAWEGPYDTAPPSGALSRGYWSVAVPQGKIKMHRTGRLWTSTKDPDSIAYTQGPIALKDAKFVINPAVYRSIITNDKGVNGAHRDVYAWVEGTLLRDVPSDYKEWDEVVIVPPIRRVMKESAYGVVQGAPTQPGLAELIERGELVPPCFWLSVESAAASSWCVLSAPLVVFPRERGSMVAR